MNNIIANNQFNDKNFKRFILNRKKTLLVLINAKWSGATHIINPILTKVLSKRDDIDFREIDYDDNPRFIEKYNINAIPTILVFRNGELIDKKCGTFSELEIIKFIDLLEGSDE